MSQLKKKKVDGNRKKGAIFSFGEYLSFHSTMEYYISRGGKNYCLGV